MTSADCIPLDRVLSVVGRLPTRGQVRLHDNLIVHDLSAGDVLFWKGNRGGSVYFVESGELSIWWEGAEQEQELLRFAGPGDIVTPAALLDRSPRRRSCLAEQRTRVIELSAVGFERLTALDWQTAATVLDGLSACAAKHPDSGDPAHQVSWLDSLPEPH